MPKSATPRLKPRKTLSLLFVLVCLAAGILMFLNGSGKNVLAGILADTIGTNVKISRLSVNPFNSSIGLYGIRVYNPEGFQDAVMTSIPEIFVKYDLGGFFRGRVHLPEIRLAIDLINVERSSSGRLNLLSLKSGKKKGAPASPGGAGQDKGEKRGKPSPVQIDKVDISIGRAQYVDLALSGAGTSRSINVNIQHVVLTDVSDPAHVVQQVVQLTLEKAGLWALSAQLNKAAAGAGLQARHLWDQARTALNGLFQKSK